jgi:putative membrane protein
MNIGQLVINSLVFSAVGIAVLFVAYFIIEKITPENTWKKITQENNIAVAIVFAALIIGISMIISAAIHG